MLPRSLFPPDNDDDDDDSDDNDKNSSSNRLSVNLAFAAAYEKRKQKQDLLNLPKDLQNSSSASSDSEAEDDVAVELEQDPSLDIKIHETIRMIKEKDPRIYDPSFKPFDDYKPPVEEPPSGQGQARVTASSSMQQKPLKYKDMVRIRATTLGPEKALNSDDEDNHGIDEDMQAGEDETSYTAAQANAKKSFVQALKASESAEADDDFLVPKNPLMAPKSQASTNARSDLYQPPPMADEDEKFLWKYLSDRAWMTGGQTQDDALWIPALRDGDDDDYEMQRQEEFETAYNFRFEEPGGDKIVTHARQIEVPVFGFCFLSILFLVREVGKLTANNQHTSGFASTTGRFA